MGEILRRAPQHVLMTADTVGGVWTYALELAGALRARGIRVSLAAMGPAPSPAQRARAARVRDLALFEGPFKLEWMDDPWDDVAQAGEWLLDIERRVNPDVIHLNGYAHAALPWRVPTLLAAHSCVYSWFKAVHGTEAPPSFGRYRDEVARGLRAAGAVVAPTQAMLEALREHYGAPTPEGRARVIPNGVDTAHGCYDAKEPFVLAAGRAWDEAKNLATLASIAPRLPWPVYVAGDTRHPNGNTQRLEGVRALGRLGADELFTWQRRASIYALPARYEPFGLSALEAALTGCALVLGDIPSLREVWDDAATYVAPEDPAALARAVRRLIDDPVLRAASGRRAYARALPFSAARMADAYLSAYRDLVLPREEAEAERPAEVI